MPKKYVTKNMRIAELEAKVRTAHKVIATLIERPNSREATIYRMEYSIQVGLEKVMWGGSVLHSMEYDGLIKQFNV